MPVELFLSPLMRPILLVRSLVFIPHRSSSHYIPLIKNIEESNTSTFVVAKRFGTGSKIFDVFDTNNGVTPLGSERPEDSLFYFMRSRAVKGSYKLFLNTQSEDPNQPDEPLAVLRAGFKSNVLLIRSESAPVAELGWHTIDHKVDAIDSYKMFNLADGAAYQWTTRGKWLERVSNLGEKESEIRERVGHVLINGTNGFTIKFDTSKVPLELGLCTAMCSFLDQWNTNLEMGGIFYPRHKMRMSWRRG